MRTVLISDIRALAAVLLAVPEAARQTLCRRVVGQAEWSDRYMRRCGRPHPDWGNGTLLDAAARFEQVRGKGFEDSGYCACFEIALAQLRKRPRAKHL